MIQNFQFPFSTQNSNAINIYVYTYIFALLSKLLPQDTFLAAVFLGHINMHICKAFDVAKQLFMQAIMIFTSPCSVQECPNAHYPTHSLTFYQNIFAEGKLTSSVLLYTHHLVLCTEVIPKATKLIGNFPLICWKWKNHTFKS